jgi:hypothetical protein
MGCSCFLSGKPKIKAVQDPDGEEDCASKKESPHGLSKACEDVCEPCGKACQTNDCWEWIVHGSLTYVDFLIARMSKATETLPSHGQDLPFPTF